MGVGYEAEQGASDFEPWATTNMDYGKFYSSFHSTKPDAVTQTVTAHVECEKRYDALLRELQECKAQLEQLRQQRVPDADDGPPSNRSASPAVSFDEQQNSSLRRKQHGDSTFPPSPRVSDPPNGSTSGVPSGRLENSAHVKHIKEKNRTSFKHTNKQQKPLTSQSLKDALNRLSRPRTAPVLHADYLRSSRGRQENIHPSSTKYDHYKYFGTAGQGAKTSWGHNRPLGNQPPYGVRTQAPPAEFTKRS